jgi:hypothetical protein
VEASWLSSKIIAVVSQIIYIILGH